MALTPFLENLLSREGEKIAIGTSVERGGINSIAGTNNIIESGTSTTAISRIPTLLSESNRLLSVGNQQGIIKNLDLASENLVKLGESATKISDSLNENIKIREAQREADLKFSLGIQDQLSEVNERLSGQVSDLAAAVSAASQSAEEAKQGSFLDSLKGSLLGNLPLVALGVGAYLFLTRRKNG